MSGIRKQKALFEGDMKKKAQKALKLMDSHGLSIDDFSYKGSGPAGYFVRIIDKMEYEPKARTMQALNDPAKWYSKSAPQKEAIIRALESGLQQINQEIVEYYTANFVLYNSANEVLKNIHVFGILTTIIQKLKKYRIENDTMLITDVPGFLKEIINENDAPFIYEKTGSWYQNFLIDEFQDTSGFQWQNFRPLVENSLSPENKSLLVGDGKQSIYRWRGGDWDLILKNVEEDLKNYNPANYVLDTNWRSDQNIIEFNNAMFVGLPALMRGFLEGKIENSSIPEAGKTLLSEKLSDISRLYEDAEQQVASKNANLLNGLVEIKKFEKPEEGSWKEVALPELVETIKMLQDNEFQARDIAVLVRRSAEGKQVIETLLKAKEDPDSKNYCLDAISNESLFLGNSSIVRLIINTIRFALNPDDKIAFAEICYNYNKVWLRSGSGNAELGFIVTGEQLPEGFEDNLLSIIQLPAYEMVERIIQLFGLDAKENVVYLEAFQDIVLDFFADGSKDINDFLLWWEDKGRQKSVQIPDAVNAIRILTIHKSKGLEFKAVLIPFCDWKLDHEPTHDNFLWCATDEPPFEEISYLPLKYGSRMESSYFYMDYFKEMIKCHIDNLNLLYVALTRAEKYLMIGCGPQSKSISRASDLVISHTQKLAESDADFANIQDKEYGELLSIGQISGPTEEDEKPVRTLTGDKYMSADWKAKIAIRKKGNHYFMNESQKGKINYGLIVHEILASIHNAEEAEMKVEQCYQQGDISSAEKETIVDQLNQILANPEVIPWFETDWKVKAEIPIISSDASLKRPDRVLEKEDSAIIIDFKTGAEDSSYKKQILEYRDLLMQMGFQNVDCFILYIAKNEVVKVA